MAKNPAENFKLSFLRSSKHFMRTKFKVTTDKLY